MANRRPNGFLRSDELSKKPFMRPEVPNPCLAGRQALAPTILRLCGAVLK
ncbi:MAG: hypothetical protein PHE61_03935 [Candidatus Omnitrophica bacterium]|nr:hypothetical protein [Candidatus Omnitrophota bacterium]